MSSSQDYRDHSSADIKHIFILLLLHIGYIGVVPFPSPANSLCEAQSQYGSQCQRRRKPGILKQLPLPQKMWCCLRSPALPKPPKDPALTLSSVLLWLHRPVVPQRIRWLTLSHDWSVNLFSPRVCSVFG